MKGSFNSVHRLKHSVGQLWLVAPQAVSLLILCSVFLCMHEWRSGPSFRKLNSKHNGCSWWVRRSIKTHGAANWLSVVNLNVPEILSVFCLFILSWTLCLLCLILITFYRMLNMGHTKIFPFWSLAGKLRQIHCLCQAFFLFNKLVHIGQPTSDSRWLHGDL